MEKNKINRSTKKKEKGEETWEEPKRFLPKKRKQKKIGW